MHIAIVTAGGAGMFCGSCMHDNTWAGALIDRGERVTLIPTYTPIRVDEENLSVDEVFFGGINVYLDFHSRLWRKLPRFMTRWLDRPWVIRTATKFGVSNDAAHLGPLTLAMLKGESGPLNREVDELVDHIVDELKPDAVVFSNALLVGALKRLKERFKGPVCCTLQGDDVFLEDLQEPYKELAIAEISRRAREFDAFLVHSGFYRDFMSRYLRLPIEKFHLFPLGIDLAGHDGVPASRDGEPFTIGYFARICPEKGLHELVEAVKILHSRRPEVRLKAGGFLGPRDEAYFNDVRTSAESLGDAFQHVGSPDERADKIAFYKSLDVLSVPTVYHEPKGLYVLEALANGVPVVQPRHGAFTELIDSTRGGLLVEPGNPDDLAVALESLMLNPTRRLELAASGREAVHQRYGRATMAAATIEILEALHEQPSNA